MKAIEVIELSYSYGGDAPKALNNISFSINKGETLGVIGLSGCGKSTLCNCLCGIIPHNGEGLMEGDVLIFGENTRTLHLPRIAANVGIVFQDPESALFLPRIENELAFGPENLCIEPDRIKATISDVCNLTGITHLLLKSPNEISGGQQQVSALAAVLCMNPEILILDEAASQLDDESCKRFHGIIKALKGAGKTIIMVEHNLDRLEMADKVLALKDGGILAMGQATEILKDRAIIEECYLS